MRAESIHQALKLCERGADFVLVPRTLAADTLLDVIESAEGRAGRAGGREIEDLRSRKDVFP